MEKLLQLATNPITLKGKVAIVTGGSRDIEKAICCSLAKSGVSLIISDANTEKANELVHKIRKIGGNAISIPKEDNILPDAENLLNKAITEFGGIDILVNKSGFFPNSPLRESSEIAWKRIIDLNLRDSYIHSKVIANKIKELGRKGQIINIASLESHSLINDPGIIETYQRNVISLTKCLAEELSSSQILVNAVSSNEINSKESLLKTDGSSFPSNPKTMNPEDFANATLFLASEESDLPTGETLFIENIDRNKG